MPTEPAESPESPEPEPTWEAHAGVHLRLVDPELDAELIHRWVANERARFWGMKDSTVEQVAAEYQKIAENPHHNAYLGYLDAPAPTATATTAPAATKTEPQFLLERYDPAHDVVGKKYSVSRGDVGMHFLVAPPTQRRPRFTLDVLEAIMAWIFADPSVERVVVEPDERNEKVHRLNELVGFTKDRIIELPDKKAWLSFCTRASAEEAARQRNAGKEL